MITRAQFPIGSLVAIIATEVRLRLRSRALASQLFSMVALVAFLIPRPHSSYAMISVGDRWLRLNEDTAMIAIAVVLGTALILLLPLFLDFGLRRDRKASMPLIHGSLGIAGPIFGLGRFVGIFLSGLFLALICAVILILTLGLRYEALPSANSIAVTLIWLLEIVALSVPAAIAFEALAGQNTAIRAVMVFSWWTLWVILSIGSVADPAHVKALISLFPADLASNDLSVGIVPIGNRAAVDWTIVASAPKVIISSSLARTGALIILGAGVAALAGRLCLKPAGSRHSGKAFTIPAKWRGAPSASLPQLPQPTALPDAIAIVMARLVTAAPFGLYLAAAALLTGFVSPRFSLVLAHISAILLIRPTTPTETRLANQFEPTLSALRGGRGPMTHTIALSLIIVPSSLTALASAAPLQCATALLGLLSACMWLVWTHRQAGLDLLGVSVRAGIVYVTGFNDIPPQLDILGFAFAAQSALAVQVAIFIGLAVLAFKRPPHLRLQRSRDVRIKKASGQ